MGEVVPFRIVRTVAQQARSLDEQILHGPITNEMIDAMEELTDDEIERLFVARAKARLGASRDGKITT